MVSAIDLPSCVNNMLRWTGCSIPSAIRAVTVAPAEVLGLSGVKGSVMPGADADLVILEEVYDADGFIKLNLNQVWKFGKCVYKIEIVTM